MQVSFVVLGDSFLIWVPDAALPEGGVTMATGTEAYYRDRGARV